MHSIARVIKVMLFIVFFLIICNFNLYEFDIAFVFFVVSYLEISLGSTRIYKLYTHILQTKHSGIIISGTS